MLHFTDLYRPHNDPDDHYDIAISFALTKLKYIFLDCIIIDSSKNKWNPDYKGVMQINYINKMDVPCFESDDVDSIILLLKALKRKIDIHICGSCEGVINLYKKDKTLFKNKIKAVYLNAGGAIYNETYEYNVSLNKNAYSEIFNLPCEIYWLPCFHDTEKLWTLGENGSYFHFKQGDLFPFLSRQLINYFLDALSNNQIDDVASSINKIINKKLYKKESQLYRNMWCTTGFLNSSHKTLDLKGNIQDINFEGKKLFEFAPIKIIYNENGKIKWKYTTNSNIKILKILDLSCYEKAMLNCLISLLSLL